MRTLAFRTSLGIVPITGPAAAFGGSRPVVLTITGLNADADDMIRTPELLASDYDGFIAALPGNRSPNLSVTSIEAFGQAFDEVLAQLGRPAVAFGVSVGGLVALAMKRPRAMLVVDPPLSTAKLWPLHPNLTNGLLKHGELLDKVMGFSQAGIVDRRYHHLVDSLAVPVEVIVGDQPLYPERPVERYPSLVDEPERRFLAAHPLVTLHVAPASGHDVPRQAPYFVFNRLRAVCSSAFAPGAD